MTTTDMARKMREDAVAADKLAAEHTETARRLRAAADVLEGKGLSALPPAPPVPWLPLDGTFPWPGLMPPTIVTRPATICTCGITSIGLSPCPLHGGLRVGEVICGDVTTLSCSAQAENLLTFWRVCGTSDATGEAYSLGINIVIDAQPSVPPGRTIYYGPSGHLIDNAQRYGAGGLAS